MRRIVRPLAAALAAAGLLVLLAGATDGPGRHAHDVGVAYHAKMITLQPGDTTITFDCPTGYRLVWVSGWEHRPGISLSDLEPTGSGQGAVITLRNEGSFARELELVGTCIKPATGIARDRKGKRHTHGLGMSELVEEIVRLDPFTGAEPSVSCPAGSVPTLGAAGRDPAVELQGSYGRLDGGSLAWHYQLFNSDRVVPLDVVLKLLCRAERTRGKRHHDHLLLILTPAIVDGVEKPIGRTRPATSAAFTAECPPGYRAIAGGWLIPEGFFEIVSERIGTAGYTLELEATSQLPTVEVSATCLAARTTKAG